MANKPVRPDTVNGSGFDDMRKSKLTDGTPFFGIKVEHFVKKEDFVKHLAEYHYLYGSEFDQKMKRMDAMRILKNGLFFNGIEGEIDETLYEGSFDVLDDYYRAYTEAMIWVERNYPYL